MNKKNLFRILIIYPPLINPSAPPPIGESLRIFDQEGLTTERYDAGIDFFKNHLFDSKRFERITGLIKEKDKSGVFEKRDDKTRTRVFEVLESGEKFKQRIVQAGRDLDFFKSQDFYEPSSYITKASEIESLCDDLSLAFYPSRIHWNGFSSPDIFEPKGLADLVQNPEKNPFIDFFEKGMDLSGIGKSDLLILDISAQSQIPASLTLSGICRKRGFACHIALMGDPALLEKAVGFSGSLVPPNDERALSVLLEKLGFKKRPVNYYKKTRGLPAGGYLCPEKVIEAGMGGSRGKFLDSLISEPGADKKISDIKDILNIHKAIRPSCATGLSGQCQPFCIAVESPLEYKPGKDVLSALFSSGVRLIKWHAPMDMPASGPGSLTKTLWSASKCGIWNHLVTYEKANPELLQGLLNYASNNPHYCHSWATVDSSDTKSGRTLHHIESEEPPYGKVTPLPGYPFWRGCMDIFHLLVHINRSGTKKVMRWRIDESGTSIDTIGEGITYHYKKPEDLSPQSFEQICLLVEAGGAVGAKWIRHNLERAYLIGFAMEKGAIAGTVSLKNPRREFIEYMKGKTGIDLGDFVERGYNSARPQYRGLGIGSVLVKGLTERVGEKRLYSTISSDNLVAQEIARRTGTKNVAVYYSERLGKDVGVWIPRWMLND